MHSTSRQRMEALSFDKENAKLLNKMPPGVAIARKVASASVKLRKNSDNTDDRPLQMKGLQVTTTNVLDNNIIRRRIQSSSDSTTKAFMKSRFAVYGSENAKGPTQSTEKPSTLKSREIDKTKEIEKWLKSVNEARILPSNRLVVENKKVDEKSGQRPIPKSVVFLENKKGSEKGQSSLPKSVVIVERKKDEKSSQSSLPRPLLIIKTEKGDEKSGHNLVPRPVVTLEYKKSNQNSHQFASNYLRRVEKKQNEKTVDPAADSKKSPKHLPIIPKREVDNIKEKHNKKSVARKTPKVAYEILSLELAYNLDYMTEYIRYQTEINEKKKLSSSFLKKGVTVDQRRLIVKYLIDSTTYFKSPSFVLYQAVKIFDSYIDKVSVSLYELQSIALAALWIALKKDLIIDDIPEAGKIMRLGATQFKGDRKLLLECEKKILMSLKFEVNFADSFSMLALFAIMIDEVRELNSTSIQELYYCGSYLMDLSMLDNDLCDVLALHLAEICTEIALVVIMTSLENLKNVPWNHWRSRVLEANPILQRYLLPGNKMDYIRNQLLHKVVLSKDKESDYNAVYKKYCTKRYGTVAFLLTYKVSSLFYRKSAIVAL